MSQRGFTFIELVVVTTILLVLASTVMPLAQVTMQRQREVELHRALREMRTALDKFKDAVDQGLIPSTELEPANEAAIPVDKLGKQHHGAVEQCRIGGNLLPPVLGDRLCIADRERVRAGIQADVDRVDRQDDVAGQIEAQKGHAMFSAIATGQ